LTGFLLYDLIVGVYPGFRAVVEFAAVCNRNTILR